MSDLFSRKLRVTSVALTCCAVLLGCGSFDSASNKIASIITPYRVDVVQGNVVTREQVAALKPGMSRNQVRDVLGTSLLVSVFHADRWDYAFTLKRQGVASQSRKVTVFFSNDAMQRVEAEDLPSESEFVATLKSSAPEGKLPALEATPETLSAFPVSTNPTVPAAAPVTVPIEYPPLEPAGK
jgi:outer membrane protein assembly factor BamE